MADQLQFRGGNTSEVSAASVASREIIIDTQTNQIVLGSAKDRTAMEGKDVEFNSAEFGTDYISSPYSQGPNIRLNSTTDSNSYPLGSSTFRNDAASFTEGDRDSFNDGTALVLRNNDKANVVSGSFMRFDTIGQSGYLSNWWVGAKQEVANSTNDDTNGSSFKISQLTKNRDDEVTDRLVIERTGDVLIGGTLPSAPNIELKSDGAGVFNGRITVNNEYVRVNRQNSSDPVLIGRQGNTETMRLIADGRANFNGAIKVYDSVGAIKMLTNTAGEGVITTDTNNDLRLQVNESDQLRLRDDGSSTFTGPVSIGGTAAANTIDEYEEGTFSFTVTNYGGSAATFSVNNNTGKYVLIGDVVHIYIKFRVNDTSMSGREFQISGVPLGNGSDSYASVVATYDYGADSSIGGFLGQYLIFKDDFATVATNKDIFISFSFTR